MIILYGKGKCPVCGDFGDAIEKDAFHCAKCEVSFDDFMMLSQQFDGHYTKFWA